MLVGLPLYFQLTRLDFLRKNHKFGEFLIFFLKKKMGTTQTDLPNTLHEWLHDEEGKIVYVVEDRSATLIDKKNEAFIHLRKLVICPVYPS